MEGIIIQGTREAKKTNFKLPIIIAAIAAAVILLFSFIGNLGQAVGDIQEHTHGRYCYEYQYRDDYYDDVYADGLKDYKMDCEYSSGVFGLAVGRTSLIPSILIVGIGVAISVIRRKNSKGFTLSVSETNIFVEYTDGKKREIPVCSVFSVEKNGASDLCIVTSENSHTFKGISDRDAVADAIVKLMPEISVGAPVNNEQVLAKAYPPAIRPLLLVLLILIGFFGVVLSIAFETAAVLAMFIIPFAIVLVLYLLAKTPYLVVTDKRVFYVSDFGHKLSMPLNRLTVVASHRFFRQLHIAAATGRIHLFWVRNNAQIYDMICALLNEKQ